MATAEPIRLADYRANPDDEAAWTVDDLRGNLRAVRSQLETRIAYSDLLARALIEVRDRADTCTCGAFGEPSEQAIRRAVATTGPGSRGAEG